jgi:uncharacterized protein (UPF0335 family)
VLRAYDAAQNQEQVLEAIREINRLSAEFSSLRKELEDVYAKTRILEKPRDYILDQDHHVHLANQGTTFDWQFYAERVFLDKLQQELLDETPAE